MIIVKLKNLKKQKNVFENYKDCLFNNKIILKSQQRFKSDHHKVYIEEIDKIALSSNDDKRYKHIHMEQMLLKYVKVKW